MYMKEFGLHRYENNPIITPQDIEGSYATFNCGQTMYKGKTILLVAAQMKTDPIPRMYVAESEDGINFKIRKEPLITQSKNPIIRDLDTWPIDPRITYIPEDDMYYIMRPINSDWGCSAVLGRTKDFETYEDLEIIALPHNRVPSLFPGKINGLYARIDRPYDGRNEGRMWISFSPDLKYWGGYRPLLKQYTIWNYTKIGPTPPIKTKDGWLVIIHGVSTSCADSRYSLGAMLLDLEDPTKVIGKTMSPILTPDAPYEYMGTVPNVIFSCGAIADEEKDEIRVYYGAADTYIALATGKLSEIIRMCKEEL